MATCGPSGGQCQLFSDVSETAVLKKIFGTKNNFPNFQNYDFCGSLAATQADHVTKIKIVSTTTFFRCDYGHFDVLYYVLSTKTTKMQFLRKNCKNLKPKWGFWGAQNRHSQN
jgi:hypothetical protein